MFDRRKEIIMKLNIKKVFKPACYAAIGLLTIVFMLFGYAAAFASYGGESRSEGMSAYKCMNLGEESLANAIEQLLGSEAIATFFFTFAAIGLILMLILSIALVLMGVDGFLKEFAGIDLLKNVDAKLVERIYKIIYRAYFISNVASAGCLAIACLLNTYSVFGMTMGFRPDFGMYLLVIFAVAVWFGLPRLEKKIGLIADVPEVTYQCSACGAKAKAGDKFCSVCGAAVVSTEPSQTEPAQNESFDTLDSDNNVLK